MPIPELTEARVRALAVEQGIDADTFARGLAIAAKTFVLAHEMGHVAAGDFVSATDREAAHVREFEADLWAISHLLALSSAPAPSPPRGESASLTTLAWPAHLTIPAAAIFLCFDGLRQRYAGIDSSATHPSATVRLATIRQAVVAANLEDGDVPGGFDVVVQVFDFLLPYVHRQHPDWVLSTDELREMAQLGGADPSLVPDGAVLTLRDVYTNEVVETLRSFAKAAQVTVQDVDELQDLAARMPQVVIDLLGRAYDGTLLPPADPDATAVYRLGQSVAARFTDAPLREAVIAG